MATFDSDESETSEVSPCMNKSFQLPHVPYFFFRGCVTSLQFFPVNLMATFFCLLHCTCTREVGLMHFDDKYDVFVLEADCDGPLRFTG